ncbi:MAG: DUF1702 family protein, partial [Longimicrobiales bacterium]|nr:DUF1702 family protein [Longimicrobiales bacterium]
MSLELATSSFLEGYRIVSAAGPDRSPRPIVTKLLELEELSTPFAFEGAAMAWTVLDHREGHRSLASLVESAGEAWTPFVDLGHGCGLARIGSTPSGGDLVLDGYGFQLGLAAGISGMGRESPTPRSERGRGRALWFITGGEAGACAAAFGRASHPSELWRGLGTACAFAGDPLDNASRLPELAGVYGGDLRAGIQDAADLWSS